MNHLERAQERNAKYRRISLRVDWREAAIRALELEPSSTDEEIARAIEHVCNVSKQDAAPKVWGFLNFWGYR